jgi:hypothetical protein
VGTRERRPIYQYRALAPTGCAAFLLFLFKLFSRFSENIVHRLANDIFGYLASLPIKFWHFPGKRIQPLIK